MMIMKQYYKLGKPATVKQIADEMNEVPAKVHYHVKKLESVGILKLKQDSPIMETLVFALAADCANTSEKCAASLAFKPNAVSASVTISLVVPKSSPDAAARFRIPSIPSSICC